MFVNDIIKIDMHKQSAYPVIFAKQYDNGLRKVTIELLDNDLPFLLSGNCIAKLRYTKNDGTQGLDQCTYDGNIVTFTLTDNILYARGRVKCDIAIYQNTDSSGNETNNCISSSIFYIQSDESAYDNEKAESSDEYSALIAATNACKKATDNCIAVTNKIDSRLTSIENILAQIQDSLKPTGGEA